MFRYDTEEKTNESHVNANPKESTNVPPTALNQNYREFGFMANAKVTG